MRTLFDFIRARARPRGRARAEANLNLYRQILLELTTTRPPYKEKIK